MVGRPPKISEPRRNHLLESLEKTVTQIYRGKVVLVEIHVVFANGSAQRERHYIEDDGGV